MNHFKGERPFTTSLYRAFERELLTLIVLYFENSHGKLSATTDELYVFCKDFYPAYPSDSWFRTCLLSMSQRNMLIRSIPPLGNNYHWLYTGSK